MYHHIPGLEKLVQEHTPGLPKHHVRALVQNAMASCPLACTSDQSGTEEVYVQPYPSLDGRRVISRNGGREPRGSPDGRELYYRRDRGVYAVSITSESTFAAGNPELMFEGDVHISPGGAGNNHDWDVSPDGTRFLMIHAEAPQRRIRVVLIWFHELKRLVPID